MTWDTPNLYPMQGGERMEQVMHESIFELHTLRSKPMVPVIRVQMVCYQECCVTTRRVHDCHYFVLCSTEAICVGHCYCTICRNNCSLVCVVSYRNGSCSLNVCNAEPVLLTAVFYAVCAIQPAWVWWVVALQCQIWSVVRQAEVHERCQLQLLHAKTKVRCC